MLEYIQLQFKFMRNVSLQCYVRAEINYMNRIYNVHFKKNGVAEDDFLSQIYVPFIAKYWNEKNKHKYFKGIDDIL